MAKSRMVSADIRTDEEVNSWPIELRYFWVMLWGYVDDFGRGRYNPRLVKADVADEAQVVSLFAMTGGQPCA